MWDRAGRVEDVFQNFTSLVGCAGKGLDCLRAASEDTLVKENEELNRAYVEGSFIVGPATDGNFVTQVPVLEYASGNYWKDIDSLILSHTKDEAELFVNGHIQSDQEFTEFIEAIFPAHAK